LVGANVNEEPLNAVIEPSMKLTDVLATLTRSPILNAVAVFAKLVAKEIDPELEIVALEVDVNPA
jgi:hypothetical protein